MSREERLDRAVRTVSDFHGWSGAQLLRKLDDCCRDRVMRFILAIWNSPVEAREIAFLDLEREEKAGRG